MTKEQKNTISLIIAVLSLIISVVWFLTEPKFETLLLSLSTAATAFTLYVGKRKAEKLKARYIIYPDRAFKTSVALWGPTSSGKTWLLSALAQTIIQNYKKPVGGLYYEVSNINKAESISTPPSIAGTQGLISKYYIFERSRSSFDSESQALSSYKHEIVIYDDKGVDTLDYSNPHSMTLQNMADADIVVLALDPIQVLTKESIRIYHEPNNGLIDEDNYVEIKPFSKDEYAEKVAELFKCLERLRPDKKRYYAVCITKIDLVSWAIYRDPIGLIQLWFGDEMVKALEIPDKDRVKVFSTSSFGFIGDVTGVDFRANFYNGSLMNFVYWKPYRVEHPFFWAFQEIELLALKDNLTKTWWRRISAKRKMKKYIKYPQETFSKEKD